MMNKDVSLGDLLEPEYIGSFSGSTQKELVLASQDHHIHAEAVQGLTLEALRHSSVPIILHVKDNRRSRRFNHWVLYLGMEGDKARILDPSYGVERMSMARLLARWGGVGILVSEHPQHRLSTTWVVWRDLGGVCLLFVIAAACIRFLVERNENHVSVMAGRSGALALPCAILLMGSIVLGVGFNLAVGSGLLRNPVAVGDVQRRYHSTFLPKLTVEEVRGLLGNEDVVFVDARRRRDFRKGHLPRAVSMPVNASMDERDRIMDGLPNSKRIVVYCQSSGCGYAQEVADILSVHGYDRISLYPGGWREWKTQLK
jgi:rhodanese-related sulfurtransferase